MCDYYFRGTTISGGLLFEGDYYFRGTTINFVCGHYLRGSVAILFDGEYYLREAFISLESM